MNNSILLWLVLLYCMHAQGTPMACHWKEEGPRDRGNARSPRLFPERSRAPFGAVGSLSGLHSCPCAMEAAPSGTHRPVVADTAWPHGGDSSA